MKTATVKQLKDELKGRTPEELVEISLHLSKFKKENKELLTYLLFEVDDEASYIESVKEEVDEQFSEINTSTYYFMKKSIRKILRSVKKHIRYSKKKETEVELLLHFCKKLKSVSPSMTRNTVLINIYERQIILIEKAISTLHEDMQYDYQMDLEELLS